MAFGLRFPKPNLCFFVVVAFVAACGEFTSPRYFPDDPAGGPPSFVEPGDGIPGPGEGLSPCHVVFERGWPAGAGFDEVLDGQLGTSVGASIYGDFSLFDADPTLEYFWFIESGVLPPGLALDAKAGRILGFAQAPGAFLVRLGAGAITPDGERHLCEALDVPIRVAPACVGDDDCRLASFEGVPLACRGGETTSGGVCTWTVKPEECPGVSERVQLQVTVESPGGQALSREASLFFSGVVTHHEDCRETRFSMDDGGHDAYCFTVLVEAETEVLLSKVPAETEITVSYRLPHGYRAPITEGGRYGFFIARAGDGFGAPTAEVTLFVFSAIDPATGVEPAVRGRPLVLAAHTGRTLPHHLLERCAEKGSCPQLTVSHMLPTDCGAVSSSLCGARTPTMLLVKDPRGQRRNLMPYRAPALFGSKSVSADGLPPYALHLAASETFVGEDAGQWASSCFGAEADYRVSYVLLPSHACVQARVSRLGEYVSTAPARLLVGREPGFAPSGRPLAVSWRVVDEPSANRLFDNADPLLKGPYAQDFIACVPGFYEVGVDLDDGVGTPSCGVDESTLFAVLPPADVYVELLSERASRGPELRVVPIAAEAWAYDETDGPSPVASIDNPTPDWALGPYGEHLAVVTGVHGCGARNGKGDVQIFHATSDLIGRFRIVVAYPDDSAASGGAPVQQSAEITLRTLLAQNLASTQSMKYRLEPGDTVWLGELHFGRDVPRFYPYSL